MKSRAPLRFVFLLSLLAGSCSLKAWGDDTIGTGQDFRWQPEIPTSTLSNYRLDTFDLPAIPSLPATLSSYQVLGLGTMDIQMMSPQWKYQWQSEDYLSKLTNTWTSGYTNLLDHPDIESSMVTMTPSSFLPVYAGTLCRTGLTLGVRPIILAARAIDLVPSKIIPVTAIARGIVRLGEGALDRMINQVPGGSLVTRQFQAGDSGIRRLESLSGWAFLARDLTRHLELSSKFYCRLGPELLVDQRGQLYWPINRIEVIQLSVDCPGVWTDIKKEVLGRCIISPTAERAYTNLANFPPNTESGTHIAGIRELGSLQTSPYGLTYFDKTKIVITEALSTRPGAFVNGRLFGYDPETDQIRRTTIQYGWQVTRYTPPPQSSSVPEIRTSTTSFVPLMRWASGDVLGLSPATTSMLNAWLNRDLEALNRFSNWVSSSYVSPAFGFGRMLNTTGSPLKWTQPSYQYLPSITSYHNSIPAIRYTPPTFNMPRSTRTGLSTRY